VITTFQKEQTCGFQATVFFGGLCIFGCIERRWRGARR
jgi:hypothetical protein